MVFALEKMFGGWMYFLILLLVTPRPYPELREETLYRLNKRGET